MNTIKRLVICALFCLALFPYVIGQVSSTDSILMARGLLQEGRDLLELGEYEESYLKFKEGLALKPNVDFVFYIGFAAAACETGRLEECNEYLLEAISRGQFRELLLKAEFFDTLRQTKNWESILSAHKERQDSFLMRFKLLREHPIHSFIPFKKGRLWGYMHKDSREILVEPIFLHSAFPGDRLKVMLNNNYYALVSSSMELSFEIGKKKFRGPPPPMPPRNMPVKRPEPTVDPSLSDYGFTLNDDRVITHIGRGYNDGDKSSKLSYSNRGKILYRSPFKLEGQWCMIAQLDSTWQVFNNSGNIVKALPSEYTSVLELSYFNPDDPWFGFYDKTKNAGFCRPSGETRFVKKGRMLFAQHNFDLGVEWRVSIISDGNKTGVVNLDGMKMLIEPTKERVSSVVKCTFEGDVSSPPKYLSSKVKALFFHVRSTDGGDYYMGEGNIAYKVD